MREKVSPSFGRSAVRLCVAVLLASAATGCSSDVTRFTGGLFSNSDQITTNSVPRRGIGGTVPVPRGTIQSGQLAAADNNARNQALNQPFPEQAQSDVSYDPVNTASTPVSGTRLASTPIRVERNVLAVPTAVDGKNTALEQPFPTEKRVAKADTKMNPDPVTTGTARKAGWSADNAPAVKLRQGETIASLSDRYGVPQKEILKANGLTSASQAQPGQKIIIPTYGVAGSAVKAAASDAASNVDIDKKLPHPDEKQSRDVAILPGSQKDREKKSADTLSADGKLSASAEGAGKGGSYTVQSGDSLNKIAKKNGVSVDALKKANGLDAAAIRIGQTLKIPGKGTSTDSVVTASVPVGKKAEAETGKVAGYTPPVAKESVTEAASNEDALEQSPKATGISKYRWPVRGAVIAGYGANVDGNRNDGIDISVPEGTPIKAAENGVVIYSGGSLKNLGNAVLVRHDDGTVTVYGNAGDLKVQRGQKIQRGQTLASSGMSGNAKRPQVHFEVRKKATPVNPATYLE